MSKEKKNVIHGLSPEALQPQKAQVVNRNQQKEKKKGKIPKKEWLVKYKEEQKNVMC